MTALGDAIRAAIESKVGAVQRELVPDREPDYDELRRLFGSNEAIATAAGYGRPGQHPRGSAPWTRRRTFMRNLQRYEQGRTGGSGQRRRPVRLAPRLRNIARAEQRRLSRPGTVRDVVRLMGAEGTTSTLVIIKFRYSSRKNPERPPREIELNIYTWPEVYRDVGWPMQGRAPRSEGGWNTLGELYLDAWAIAYGIPDELPAAGVDAPVFMFTIGREEPVAYDYR